jgi:hypothetical protein
MILPFILPALLIALAAISKAVADTVAHHFDTSVFKRYKRAFWDKNYSADFAKRIFNYKVDAWHLANSFMIVCFVASAPFTPPVEWYYFIPAAGFLYIVVFNLFYNKIFR